MSSTWEHKVLENVLLASVKEQRRSRRWGIFFKLIVLAYVLYFTFAWIIGRPKPVLKDHVALIDLIGVVGQDQEIDADATATSLRKAFEENKAKAVILRINSPGGSPVQAAYIFDELKRLKGLHPDKKVYAVCMDLCASAGYYIAAGADQIYANASSVVGSIGVLMPNFGFVDTMQKVGVQQRSLSSGKDKMFLDPFSPENPEQVTYAKALLGQVHQQFINAVKEGRGTRLRQPEDQLFTGLFWTGEKARDLGLVDGLGSAGFVAREVLGSEEIIDYSATHNWYDRLASGMGSSFAKRVSSELGFSKEMALR